MTIESPEFKALELRLKRLERQHRRLRKVGFLLVLPVIAILVMGQTKAHSPTFEATEFRLRDSQERTRAALTIEDDRPMLIFFDREGQHRTLTLGDSASLGPSLQLGMGSTNLVSLSILGARLVGNQSTLSLDTREGCLLIDDKRGDMVAIGRAAFAPDTVRNAYPVSEASIQMFDKDGKVIWRAP